MAGSADIVLCIAADGPILHTQRRDIAAMATKAVFDDLRYAYTAAISKQVMLTGLEVSSSTCMHLGTSIDSSLDVMYWDVDSSHSIIEPIRLTTTSVAHGCTDISRCIAQFTLLFLAVPFFS